MFTMNQETKPVACEPGVSRKLLCHSENQMMTEVSFAAGACGNVHSHPHEQITYVAAGSFAFTIGDETTTLVQRDSAYIPPNVLHGVKALEAGVLVDVFTPARADFL